MSVVSLESLVEQRVAQLEAISTRRNELLRQMYHMMRRRSSVGLVLTLDETDEGDLQSFLQRFDYSNNPDTASIANLGEAELISGLQEQPLISPLTPSPTLDKNPMRRTTRSQSRATGLTNSPSPSPSKHSATPVSLGANNPRSPIGQDSVRLPFARTLAPKDMDIDDDRDELDLIGSPLSDKEKNQVKDVAEELVPHPGHLEKDKRLPTPLSPKSTPTFSSEPMEASTEVTEGKAEPSEVLGAEGDHTTKIGEEVLEDALTKLPSTAGPVDMIIAKTPLQVVAEQPINRNNEVGEDPDMLMREPLTDLEDDIDDTSEAEVSRTVDRPSSLSLSQAIILPSSDQPIKSSIPLISPGSSSPIQPAQIPRLPVIILAPNNSTDTTTFTFDQASFTSPEPLRAPSTPVSQRHQFNPNYILPPLKSLPVEFNRKVKQKQRKKEREKNDSRQDDWFPMGVNRWSAILNANPVWKRVTRASKCLSTREWTVAMTELKLIRTFDRIETLKDGGRWSFRQPKKQRGVGGLMKTHWDYLMDEMRWMRIDFREERRWKMALAYHLATAVLEWHAAGSLEERVKRGISVSWNPTYFKTEEQHDDLQNDEFLPANIDVSQESELAEREAGALLGVDYGSDEDEDEEREKDQQYVVDALQPQNMLEDTLEVPSQDESRAEQDKPVKPKTEESDDVSVLQLAGEGMQIDTQPSSETMDQSMADAEEKDVKGTLIGLKSTSNDPVLGTKASSNSSSNNGDTDTLAASTKYPAKQLYASLREQLLESDLDKLFLGLDDFHITHSGEPNDGNENLAQFNLPPADFSTIFPELQPLGLLDVPSVTSTGVEGRKKSDKRSDRDDPNKRIEDTTYTKLFPIGQFMYAKPTLIGTLQPSKNWKDEKWTLLDEVPVYVEYDGPTKPPEDAMSHIFDNRLSNSTVIAQHQLLVAAAREREKDRKRSSEHQWSANDDTLLKSLIDRYPYNWQLISESFNATRVTTPTDKRTARDCFERWREKWAPDVRRHQEAQQAAAANMNEENATPPASQMTTRGIRRLASSMASPVVNGFSGSEPKKRRRHILVQETIRKSVKKKAEFQQKMLANQRKPSAIHETHVPYNNMRHYSPAELSRMKSEKDAKNTQDIQLARRRQEELARAALQSQRLTPMNGSQAQQQSLVQQQLQQQAALLQQAQQTQQQQQQTQPQQQQTPAGQQTPQPIPAQPQQAAAVQTQPTAQQAQVANIAQRQPSVLLANQALGNIRGQVNISRINSPNFAAGASRLTPQQILQLQQAQQQVRPASQPAQANQVAVHQLAQTQAQGQIMVPSLNGNGAALNGPHLAASYVNRDSTSSPAHMSPPRKSATPTNVNSPRITADQIQHGQVQMGLVSNTQVAGNMMVRPASGMSYYNIPGLTQEQMNTLRLQLLQQHQQHQQQNAQQDGSVQPPTSSGFSS